MTDQRLLNLTRTIFIRRAAMATLLLIFISCTTVIFAEFSIVSSFRMASTILYVGTALLFFQTNSYGKLDTSLFMSFSISRRDIIKAELLFGVISALFNWLILALLLLISASQESPLLVTRPYFLIYAAAAFLFSSMFGLYSSFSRSRIVQALHLIILFAVLVVSGLCCLSRQNIPPIRMNTLVPQLYIGFLCLLAIGIVLSVWLTQKKIQNLTR